MYVQIDAVHIKVSICRQHTQNLIKCLKADFRDTDIGGEWNRDENASSGLNCLWLNGHSTGVWNFARVEIYCRVFNAKLILINIQYD